MKLKPILILLIILLFSLNTIGQNNLKVKKLDETRLIKILNDAELIEGMSIDYLDHYFSVKVYTIDNSSRNSKLENDKASIDLLIAVSESDKYEKQSLFEIGPFLNPEIVDWIDKNAVEANIIVEHGRSNQRKKIKLYLNIDELNLIDIGQ